VPHGNNSAGRIVLPANHLIRAAPGV